MSHHSSHSHTTRSRVGSFLYTLLIIALASLWLGHTAPTAAQRAPHDASAQAEIEQAWQQASESDRYAFRSRIEQLVYPAPSVRNAGRQPQQDLLGLAGTIEADSDRIESTIWPDASFDEARGVDLLVENGRSYIRESAASDWVEIDDMSQMVAPAGDPLSFLAGIKQVEATGTDSRVMGDVTLEFSTYRFAIDGPTLGRYMDRMTEQMLIEAGELPQGMSVGGGNRFYDATGTGEIWLDADGYPARFVIDFAFAPEENGERITAQINSDFYDFEVATAEAMPNFATAPRTWLAVTAAEVATPERTIAFGWSLLIGLTFVLLAIFVWRHAYTKEFYTTIVSLIIVGLVLPPLLQAQEARAFYSEQMGRSHDQVERDREYEQYDQMREVLYGNDWNPQEDPYAEGRALQQAVQAVAQTAVAANTSSEIDTTADSDGDGATDDDEALWDSCPYLVSTAEYNAEADCYNVTDPSDSDGDGLTDYTEIYELGSLPNDVDSDGDTINDNLEAKGFDYNGESWYLNPVDNDTNNDGRSDGEECAIWSSNNENGDTSAICPDSDSDGTPDLYDFDDDNDGVWDLDDGDSEAVSQIFGRNNPLNLTIDGLEVDKPVLVEIQMRPEDESLLTTSGLILDWPTGDYEGQIVRGNDTTFATTTNADASSTDANAEYGDVRILPLLRITVPYADGHYANLPVNDSYKGIDRTIGVTISQWLDTTELDQLGMTVSDVDETSGDIDIYVPVSTVYSEAGERPVGFSATTFYSPTQGTNGVADWGNAHEYSLIWMVQMITDSCAADTDEDGDGDTENESGADCNRVDELTTIHIYEEDWRATSLNVSEEQGLSTAVMYEDPAQDDNLALDEQLWIAGWNLGNTFVDGLDCDSTDAGGNCIGDGVRDVMIEDIPAQLDAWGTVDNVNYNYIEVEGIDTYIHQEYLADTAVNTTADVLNTHFLSYATNGSQDYTSLLFAYETANRSVGLIDNQGTGGQISLDLSGIPAYTTAGVFLKTYAYDAADGWAEAEKADYYEYFLESLEAGDSFFQVADDGEEALDEQYGKLLWMQNYYITLTTGSASVVAIDDSAFNSVSFDTTQDASDFETYLTLAITTGAQLGGSSAGSRLSYILSYYLTDLRGKSKSNMWQYLYNLYTIREFGVASNLSNHSKNQTKAFYNDYKLFHSKQLGKVVKGLSLKMLGLSLGVFAIGALIVATGFIVTVAGDEESGNTIMQIGLVIVAIASIAVLALEALSIFAKRNFVRNLKLAGLKYTDRFRKAFSRYSNLYRMHAAWGFGISFAVAAGILLYSWLSIGFDTNNPYFDAAAAYFVATVIIELILAVLLLIFPVGTAIVIILELVDAILFLVSLLVDDFDFTIQGWLTQALADLMYNVDMVAANIESDKRIQTAGDYGLWDSELGFVESNTLAFTLTVTNTLYTTDSRSDLKRNSFEHVLDTDGRGHNDFNPGDGDMVNEWNNTDDGSYNADGVGGVKYSTDKGVYSVEDLTIDFPFSEVGTGINRSTDSPYFNEAFFLIAEGCWHVFAIRGTEYNCKELTFDGGDSSELDPFTFDILPDHLGEFITLEWNSGGLAFPQQWDKDGDGEPNTEFGGSDPNDLLWDTDGDLLSDYYESTNGYESTDADEDDDGLTDWEELFVYYTDPTNADYDGDGLGDYIEAKAGWLTEYTDENGVKRATRVWSDPYTADLDDDGIGDLQEYIYGFHPALASDLSAVDGFIEFSDLRLDETDTPLLYLPLDDELGTTTINDLSGNEYFFSCDSGAGTCPTAEVLGQYDTAMSFDNVNDYLLNDDLNIELTEFTVAAYVYNGATDSSVQPVFGSIGGHSASSPPSISIFDNRDIVVGFGDGTSWNSISPYHYFIDSEEWVHVAATYDGVQLRIYVDGLGVYNEPTYAGAIPATITEMAIGRNGSDYLDGSVDEVFLYDRALSQDEIYLLIDGRYNLNDLVFSVSGGELLYQATLTNTTAAVNTDGFIYAASEAIEPVLPQPSFYLGFDEDQRWATFDNAYNVDSDVYCYEGGTTCPTNQTSITAVGTSLEFDGNDDVAFIPSLTSSSADGTAEGSLFFWLYIDEYPDAGTISYILDTESEEEGAADIYIDENGNLYLDVIGSSRVTLASTVALDTWMHVGYQQGRIYVNGAWGAYDRTSSRPKYGAGTLGADVNGESNFDGVIDEIVVFYEWINASRMTNNVMTGKYSFNGIQPHAVIKFEDLVSTSNTVFSDPSQYSNHAYCGSDDTCPSEVTGRNGTGTAVQFDGVDDYLIQTDNLQAFDRYYTYDNDITFYIYPTAYPAAGEVAYIYQTEETTDSNDLYQAQFALYLDSNGRMAISDGGDNYSVLKDAIPLNEWTYVKLDYYYDEVDISDIERQQMRRYINGQFATDFVGNSARSYFGYCLECYGDDELGLFVGAGRIGNNITGTAPFQGRIDDFNIQIAEHDFDRYERTVNYYDPVNDLIRTDCDLLEDCPAFGNSGAYGNSVSFDGATSLDMIEQLDFARGDYTISFWFYADFTLDQTLFTAYDDTGDVGVQIDLLQTGYISYSHAFPTLYQVASSSVGYNETSWHHLVATKDNDNLYLYLDGALVGTTSGVSGTAAENLNVTIGNTIDDRDKHWFYGFMDEFAIFDEAVSAEQAAYLSQTRFPALDIPVPYETFALDSGENKVVSGRATVNDPVATSRYAFEQDVEIAIDLETELSYTTYQNEDGVWSGYFRFEEVPGDEQFDNLVAYGSGGTAAEIDGNCEGALCPVGGAQGIDGRAAYFDGEDDYLLADFSGVDSSARPDIRSMSLWVKGADGTLFDSRGIDHNAGFQLSMGRLLNAAGDEYFFDMPRNEWTHLGLVIDSDSELTLYVNGVVALSGVSQSTSSADNWWIGANYGPQSHFLGYIDELKLFETELSASDIADLYQNVGAEFRFSFDEEFGETNFVDSINGYVAEPVMIQCVDLTLTSLSGAGFATNLNNIGLALAGNTLLYETADTYADTTLPLNITAAICGSDETLTATGVYSDGTEFTFASPATISVNSSGAGSAVMSHSGQQVTVAYTVSVPYENPSPLVGTDGRIGNTAYFTGEDDGHIEVTTAGIGDFATVDFTLMGWINTAETGVAVLTKSDGDTTWESGERALYVADDGTLRFAGHNAGEIVSTQQITDSNWHHFAVVWDSSAVTGTILIDGLNVGSGSSNYAPAGSDNSGNQLFIGAPHDNGVNRYFAGQLDELVLYTGRAFTNVEVYDSYQQEARWYRDSAEFTVTVDGDNPTIEVETDYAYRADGYIQFVVTGDDASSSVARMRYKYRKEGSSYSDWIEAPICADAAVTVYCPYFTSTGGGKYQILFQAMDVVGNMTETSDPFEIYVDTAAPNFSVWTDGDGDVTVKATDVSDDSWLLAMSGSISDPDIPGSSITGSGVTTNSIYVNLYNEDGTLVGSANQAAVYSGNMWTIDYEVSGEPPAGYYDVYMTVSDVIGNSQTGYLGRFDIDLQAPALEIAVDLLPVGVISQTNTITGVIIDQAEYHNPVLNFHFEEPSGTTVFYDYGELAAHVTCRVDCPQTTASGQFGRGLAFNGVDQTDFVVSTSTITGTTDFDVSDEFTIAFWVKADSNQVAAGNTTNSLVEKWDGAGYPFAIRYHNQTSGDNGRISASVFDGATVSEISSTVTISDDLFHHVVLTNDGGDYRLYIDGRSDNSMMVSGSAVVSNTADITLGHIPSDDNSRFSGVIDQFTVYDKQISAERIYAMAQADVSGLGQVEVALEVIDFTNYPANIVLGDRESTLTWNSATLDQANGLGSAWTYGLGEQENWFYIHMRGQDSDGRPHQAENVWRGLIDHRPPTVVASGSQAYGGSYATSSYTFTVTDFLLDETTLVHPCGADDLVMLTYDNVPVDAPHYGLPYQISGSCTVPGHTVSETVGVCDAAYHCAEQTIDFGTDEGVNVMFINSPTDGAVISPTKSITFTGELFAKAPPFTVELKIDNSLIDTLVFTSSVTETTWSSVWEFPDGGTHTLNARVEDDNGERASATHTFTIEGTCYVDYDGDNVTDFETEDSAAVRQGLAAASAGATVRVAGICEGVASEYGSDQLAYISQAVTLEGGYDAADWAAGSNPDVTPTFLDGAGLGRVLYVADGTDVLIRNISLVDGYDAVAGGGIYAAQGNGLTLNQVDMAKNESEDGAAMYIVTGTVTVADSTFIDNEAGGDAGGIYSHEALTVSGSYFYDNVGYGEGGVIHAKGALTVTTSTFYDNEGLFGGAIYTDEALATIEKSTFEYNYSSFIGGGAFWHDSGTLNIYNSTLSRNRSAQDGGGLMNFGTAVLRHVTVVSNTASFDGGGLHNSGTIQLYDSIIAHSTKGDCYGTDPVDNGGNIASDSTCGFTQSSSANDTDPLVKPLADNGGETETHALDQSSPAIDRASGSSFSEDQRGIVRPQYAEPDSGAYEFSVLDSCTDSPWIVSDYVELETAIACFNNGSSGSGLIQFGNNISLNGGLTAISNNAIPLEIDGQGFTLDASSSTRHFEIEAGEVAIHDLTLSNGRIDGNGGALLVQAAAVVTVYDMTFQENGVLAQRSGGSIYNAGTMTVTNSYFDSDAAGRNGGSIANVGVLHLDKSTIYYSDATSGGGIYNGATAVLTVTNSTINQTYSYAWGGAIYNDGGTINIIHTSFIDVETDDDFFAVLDNTNGSMTLTLSIVKALYGSNCTGTITDGGGNISSDNSCGFTAATSLNNTNPQVNSTLADNGGGTTTHALQSNSPALDIAACVLDEDQRGVARPNGLLCDSGSFEFEYTTIAVTPTLSYDSVGELTVDWSADSSATGCEADVYRSTTPYVGHAEWRSDLTVWSVTDGTAGDENRYYFVWLVCDGSEAAVSQEVGVFHFGLETGE